MHLVQIFGLRVIGLKFVVTDRPLRRDSSVMPEFAKVFLAESEQRRAVKLCVPANVVVGVGMEVLAVFVDPRLFGVVVAFDIDDLRVPIRFFARNIVAALEDEDSFPRGRQVISERAAACSGTDDDYVIAIVTHLRPLHLLRRICSVCRSGGGACSTSRLIYLCARDKLRQLQACPAEAQSCRSKNLSRFPRKALIRNFAPGSCSYRKMVPRS